MERWQAQFPLRARGRYLVNQFGERFKLAGVNWYGASDSWHVVGGLDMKPLEGLCDCIAEMGFSVVRLPFSTQMLREEQVPAGAINYGLNPGLLGKSPLEVYLATIDALAEVNVAVVVNNHTTIGAWSGGPSENGLWYMEGSERYTEETWINEWLELAWKLGDRPHVIGYDLRNEVRPTGLLSAGPAWGSGDHLDWALAAGNCARALVAQEATQGLIIVERLAWPQDSLASMLQPSPPWELWQIPRDRVVLSLHTYAWSGPGAWSPKAFTGQFAYAFLHAADYVFSRSLYGEMTVAALEKQMDEEFGFLLDQNVVPVWLSEFGAALSSESEMRWFHHLCSYLARKDVDFAYWPFNVGLKPGTAEDEPYGLLTHDWRPRWSDSRLRALRRLRASTSAMAQHEEDTGGENSDQPLMTRIDSDADFAGHALSLFPRCAPLPGPLVHWPDEADINPSSPSAGSRLPAPRFLWSSISGKDSFPGQNAVVAVGDLEQLRWQCVDWGFEGFALHRGIGYMRSPSRRELEAGLVGGYNSTEFHLAKEDLPTETEMESGQAELDKDCLPICLESELDVASPTSAASPSPIRRQSESAFDSPSVAALHVECQRQCWKLGYRGYEVSKSPEPRARLLGNEALSRARMSWRNPDRPGISAREAASPFHEEANAHATSEIHLLETTPVALDFEAFPDKDAFPGCNAAVLKGATIGRCKELCVTEGYTGFTMYGGDAYFRTAMAPLLSEHLRESRGSTFYVLRIEDLGLEGEPDIPGPDRASTATFPHNWPLDCDQGLRRSDRRREVLASLIPQLTRADASK